MVISILSHIVHRAHLDKWMVMFCNLIYNQIFLFSNLEALFSSLWMCKFENSLIDFIDHCPLRMRFSLVGFYPRWYGIVYMSGRRQREEMGVFQKLCFSTPFLARTFCTLLGYFHNLFGFGNTLLEREIVRVGLFTILVGGKSLTPHILISFIDSEISPFAELSMDVSHSAKSC